jgi:hypothetical protein
MKAKKEICYRILDSWEKRIGIRIGIGIGIGIGIEFLGIVVSERDLSFGLCWSLEFGVYRPDQT